MIDVSSDTRCGVAALGCAFRPSVVPRKEECRPRYTVERSFAWLGNYRRLLIRWERLFGVYRRFFAVAVMLLCVKCLVGCAPLV
jgi:hypothetical protein